MDPGGSGDYTAIEGLVTRSVTYPTSLFNDTPVFECTLTTTGSNNYGVWLEILGVGSSTGTPDIWAVRPAWWASHFPTTTTGTYANMKAIGRWK